MAEAASAAATTTAIPPRGGLPQVIYASRTHTQLRQVVRELRATSYASKLRTTVLSSRQQTCIHPRVSKAPTLAAANAGCRMAVSQNQCKFLNKPRLNKVVLELKGENPDDDETEREGGKGGVGGGGGAMRPVAASGKPPLSQQQQQQKQEERRSRAMEPPDIEDLVAVGRHKDVCPFYLSR